jgi:murein DD-endopeptidase MepM/ murein hydrolase activator NlpD
MSSVVVGCRAALTALVLTGCVVAPAWAGGTGGAAAPERPRIDELRCAPEIAVCRRGDLLSVLGSGMQGTDAVVFLGGRGPRDDRQARPTANDSVALTVQVPQGARSGRIKVIDRGVGTARSATALQVRAKAPPTPAPTPPAAPAPAVAPGALPPGVFPIRGAHTYGESASNLFTGRGGHQGNDVFAACGTPLVAAQPATVTRSAFQSRAGNYVVLKADDGRGLAYMHLREASPLQKGQRVAAGQPVGTVGQTGRASGCHLHFELWTAPGWYEGGEPIDPRPQLKAWDVPG